MKSKKGLYITLGLLVLILFAVFAAIGKSTWIFYGLFLLCPLLHLFMHGGHNHGGHNHGGNSEGHKH